MFGLTKRERRWKAEQQAAGLVLVPYTWNKGTGWDHEGFTVAGEGHGEWNPLEGDEDAFRLTVTLEIDICFGANYVIADGVQVPTVNNSDDKFSAVRLAIVRAAAEMDAQAVFGDA